MQRWPENSNTDTWVLLWHYQGTAMQRAWEAFQSCSHFVTERIQLVLVLLSQPHTLGCLLCAAKPRRGWGLLVLPVLLHRPGAEQESVLGEGVDVVKVPW